MNYRHAFHAGNAADVFKHIVLTRILLYLARKPAAFRVIDTHAGAGRYDLGGAEAARTAEWRDGIGRLEADRLDPAARALVAPYLDLVGTAGSGGAYPGSPAIALALARPQDRLLFCELEAGTAAALRRTVGRDKRAKVVALDGYAGLNAFVPPVERRGLVLVDPPFEVADEFDRLAGALVGAHRKWRDGILVAWMPMKSRRGVEQLWARLVAADIADMLRLEFAVDAIDPAAGLAGSALVVINPPFVLADEMACVLPALVRQLGRDGRGTQSVVTHGTGATPVATTGSRRA